MRKITFLLLMLLSITAFSQVEIVENFDNTPAYTVPTGWTDSNWWKANPENQCGGTGQSAIASMEFPGSQSLTTPNYAAITNNTDLTVSFSVNVYEQNGFVSPWDPAPTYEAPSTDWGSLVLEYSTDAGATWTTAYTVDDSNFIYGGSTASCVTIPATNLGALTSGTDFQARFVATMVNMTYNAMVFSIDNVSITQVATAVPNCNAVLLSPVDGETAAAINTNLIWQAATGLPTGYTLSVGTTSGGTEIVNQATVLGTDYSLAGLLAYETEYFVNIIPYNALGDATVDCMEQTFTTRVTPITGATCLTPFVVDLDVTPTYLSMEDTANFENNINIGPCGGFSGAFMDGYDVYYEITPATDISIDLNLLITNGNNGAIHIMEGCPDVATECVAFASDASQATLEEVVLSAGTSYFIVISSAGFDSTIGYTLVITKNICINPTFTLTTTADCDNGEFYIDVDITYLGAAAVLTLSDNFGNTDGNISATGIRPGYGPYASGETVVITLTNDAFPSCYFTDTIYFYCPPVNDDCGDSIGLTVNTDENCTTVFSGTNAGASENIANPINCEVGFANTNDVWYTFVADNETIILEYLNIEVLIGVEDPFNTSQTTELLSGDCGTFTSLGCFRNNYVEFHNLSIGATYYIRNSSRTNDVAHNYDICLRWPNAEPANDECDDAIALTLSTDETCNNTTAGSTLGSTVSTDNSCNSGNTLYYGDVWYKFTAVDAGVYQLNYTRLTAHFEPDLYLKAYSGTCGALSPLNDNCFDNGFNPQVYFMDAGETVYIMIRTSNTAPNVDFELCIYQLPDAVANNDCSNSEEVLESVDATGNNMISATFENSYPSAENACNSNNTIWYNFTPAYTGLYNIEMVQNSGFPRLAIYNTDDCSDTSGNLVAGTGCFQGATITPDLVAGQTYLIAISDSANTAAFDLTIYPDPSLGVESNSFETFKYYPNPVVNTLTVEAKNTISTVSIFNIVGQQVQLATPNSLKSTINMDELENGVYFVTITIDGSQKTIKVIKK